MAADEQSDVVDYLGNSPSQKRMKQSRLPFGTLTNANLAHPTTPDRSSNGVAKIESRDEDVKRRRISDDQRKIKLESPNSNNSPPKITATSPQIVRPEVEVASPKPATAKSIDEHTTDSIKLKPKKRVQIITLSSTIVPPKSVASRCEDREFKSATLDNVISVWANKSPNELAKIDTKSDGTNLSPSPIVLVESGRPFEITTDFSDLVRQTLATISARKFTAVTDEDFVSAASWKQIADELHTFLDSPGDDIHAEQIKIKCTMIQDGESLDKLTAAVKMSTPGRKSRVGTPQSLTSSGKRLTDEQRRERDEARQRAKSEKEHQKQQERAERDEKKKAEREEKERLRLVAKEAKGKLKQLERDETNRVRQEERQEKERKRQEERDRREQVRLAEAKEKLRIKEEKEAAIREAEEADSRKRQQAASRFAQFFSSSTKSNVSSSIQSGQGCTTNSVNANECGVESDKKMTFTTFEVKRNMRLAPKHRRSPLKSITNLDWPSDCGVVTTDYLQQLIRNSLSDYLPGTSARTWPRDSTTMNSNNCLNATVDISDDESSGDKRFDEDGDELLPPTHLVSPRPTVLDCDNFVDCRQYLAPEGGRSASRRPKAKLFQFFENRRPPYFGTWDRVGICVTGRRPFAREGPDLVSQYEYDSDEDWEEEDENGESLSDEEKDIREDANEGANDAEDEDDDDGFFVGHGVLDKSEVLASTVVDEEDDDVENERELNKDGDQSRPDGAASSATMDWNDELERRKQEMKAKQFEMEYERRTKTGLRRLKPRIYGCLFTKAESEKSEPSALSRFAAINTFYVSLSDERPAVPIPTVVDSHTLLSNVDASHATVSSDLGSKTPTATTTSNKAQSAANSAKMYVKQFPEEAMPDLIRLVHASTQNKANLVKEFCHFWSKGSQVEKATESAANSEATESACSSPKTSRTSESAGRQLARQKVNDRISAIAEYTRYAKPGPMYNKLCWVVLDDVLRQYFDGEKADGDQMPTDARYLTIPNNWTFQTLAVDESETPGATLIRPRKKLKLDRLPDLVSSQETTKSEVSEVSNLDDVGPTMKVVDNEAESKAVQSTKISQPTIFSSFTKASTKSVGN